MHCHHCGKPVSTEGRFCNHCGAFLDKVRQSHGPSMLPADVPESTNIQEYTLADIDHCDEQPIFHVRPSFYAVGLSYSAAALVSIVATAITGFLNLPLSASLSLTVLFFLFPAYKHLQRNLTSYTLTTNRVEINAGLFSRTTRHIPLQNIQNVLISATLRERLIGIGNVVIDSASVTGKIQMRQVRNPRKYADLILQQLYRSPKALSASR
jgi:membrane protein YdbS with pleckstrin-like domain